MKRKMTRLARASKCGCFGSRGFVEGAERDSSPSKPSSATWPKPHAARRRASRRERGAEYRLPCVILWFMLFDIQKFIGTEQRLTVALPGGEAAFGFRTGLSYRGFQIGIYELQRELLLVGGNGATERQTVGPVAAHFIGGLFIRQQPAGQVLRLLADEPAVQQKQRL